jgi:localization factor PodJL
MATNSLWSVKGVDPEAREAAKIAARKQGVNVGCWLSQTILAAASEELRSKRSDSDQRSVDSGQNMNRPREVHRDEKGYDNPPRQDNAPSGPPALTAEAVLESIQKLASRIEQSEHRTTEAIQPIADNVGELGEQIEEIKNKSGDGASTAPVERAMMRLSERLDRMEDTSKGPSRPSRTSDESAGFLGRHFGRD